MQKLEVNVNTLSVACLVNVLAAPGSTLEMNELGNQYYSTRGFAM